MPIFFGLRVWVLDAEEVELHVVAAVGKPGYRSDRR